MEFLAISYPPQNTLGKKTEGPRVNDEIKTQTVRLIDADGEMVGVVSLKEGLIQAREAGLDLVEISPQADPPVCRILDYGKFRYEQQKKKHEAKKNQKTIDIKEIQVRPVINEHDLQTKCKAISRFLSDGDKVKVCLRFKGRELDHPEIGLDIINRIREAFASVSKVDNNPKIEGKQMVMILSPIVGMTRNAKKEENL